MKTIVQFARDHSGPIKFFGGFIVGIIPIFVVFVYDSGVSELLSGANEFDLIKNQMQKNQSEIAIHNFIIRIYVGLLASVALLYVFYYFFERREHYHIRHYSGDQEYLNFCRDRTRSISAFRGNDLTKPIYGTSHSNMFVRPDSKTKNVKEDVLSENEKFYRMLAKLVRDSGESVQVKLLIYIGENKLSKENKHKWESRAKEELETRSSILKDVFGDSDFRHKFLFAGLVRKFLTDYLVIENHVFITVRKPESRGAPVSCIHIEHPETAEIFRNWLIALSDTEANEYIDANRLKDLIA